MVVNEEVKQRRWMVVSEEVTEAISREKDTHRATWKNKITGKNMTNDIMKSSGHHDIIIMMSVLTSKGSQIMFTIITFEMTSSFPNRIYNRNFHNCNINSCNNRNERSGPIVEMLKSSVNNTNLCNIQITTHIMKPNASKIICSGMTIMPCGSSNP